MTRWRTAVGGLALTIGLLFYLILAIWLIDLTPEGGFTLGAVSNPIVDMDLAPSKTIIEMDLKRPWHQNRRSVNLLQQE